MTPVQSSLFDAPTTHGRTRLSDPVTALEAGRHARTNVQKQAIASELGRGARTPDQLAEVIGVHRSVVASRLAQMRSDGTVAVCGIAPGPSGRDVQLWRLA